MARRDAAQSRWVRLTRELIRIRWRGLNNLEVHNSHQDPLETPDMDQLAAEYSRLRGVVFDDRVAEIRFLLDKGVAAYTAQGHEEEGKLLRKLFFEPADSVPPQTPLRVLEDVKTRMELEGKDFNAWRRTAFSHLAAFLIAFVAAAHETTAPQPTDVVPVTPIPEASPQQRPGCGRAALAGVVALMITCVVVARLLVGAAVSPHQMTTATSAQATIAAGTVECWPDTTKPVVGVWIVASNGGSGWADWHALPGRPNIALFSRTLPHGGSYVMHAGCGGTPRHWELALDSVTPTLGSGYRFTCYDTTADRTPYLGLCQP